MAETDLYDVIIVGAGISGLTAAHHLKRRDKNLHVLVLEAKDRVGGRTQTVSIKSQNGTDKWDAGGQWVGRCQPHIMSLLLELGLETHPQYTQGRKLLQLAGSTVTEYAGDLPSLSLFALIDLHRFMSKVEDLRKQVDPADPYACPMAENWDAISFEEFVQKSCFTQGAIDTLLVDNRAIYGTEANQISFLFWLMYTSAADGLLKIVEATEFTAQEGTIKGGAQQISEQLAKCIGRENIRLGEPVASIEQDDKQVTITTSTGHSFSAKFAILAFPPPLMTKIQFSPPLPEIKKKMCERMIFGNYIKIIITFEETFWRSQGFSGEVMSNGGMTAVPNCSAGPVCIVYDACLHNGSPALLGFIAGDIKIEWTQQTPEVRRRAVLDQLADYFGKGVYTFLDYVEKDWNQEPYTWGGPACIMPVGTMTFFAKAIRQSFDRLHFAGTETATSWCGYMNGAVQAGLRAAAEILEKIRPQSLCSEDFSALEDSRPSSKPADGLSRPRWLLQPRKSSRGFSLFKWTVVFCTVVGLTALAKRQDRLPEFLTKKYM